MLSQQVADKSCSVLSKENPESVMLCFENKTFPSASLLFFQLCDRFPSDVPEAPYPVQSKVSSEAFNVFVEALNGNDIKVTEDTAAGLSELAKEFGLSKLKKKHLMKEMNNVKNSLKRKHIFFNWVSN
jgi:hypothetical protein